MNVSVAIDDFGTGYSSLRYLQQLPLDALKIDRSFVSPSHAGATDHALIETIVSLARKFNLRTVAEGVETNQQLHFLASVGCDEAQGFKLGKPLSPEALEARFLVAHHDSNKAA